MPHLNNMSKNKTKFKLSILNRETKSTFEVFLKQGKGFGNHRNNTTLTEDFSVSYMIATKSWSDSWISIKKQKYTKPTKNSKSNSYTWWFNARYLIQLMNLRKKCEEQSRVDCITNKVEYQAMWQCWQYNYEIFNKLLGKHFAKYLYFRYRKL